MCYNQSFWTPIDILHSSDSFFFLFFSQRWRRALVTTASHLFAPSWDPVRFEQKGKGHFRSWCRPPKGGGKTTPTVYCQSYSSTWRFKLLVIAKDYYSTTQNKQKIPLIFTVIVITIINLGFVCADSCWLELRVHPSVFASATTDISELCNICHV